MDERLHHVAKGQTVKKERKVNEVLLDNRLLTVSFSPNSIKHNGY